MKIVDSETVSKILREKDLQLGSWNQIAPLAPITEGDFVSYQAPADASELFVFSACVSTWLSDGDWKLLQIDNSTVMDGPGSEFLLQLLSGCMPQLDEEQISHAASILFEFDATVDRTSVDRRIANLVFAFLLLELHGQLVSSGGDPGKYISLQDGFVYFVGTKSAQNDAADLLRKFEANPLAYPPCLV